MIYNVVLISFLIWSCSHKPISKTVREEFTNRFEGKIIGIREKINIDGYYQYWKKGLIRVNSQTGQRDTGFFNVVFYDDGTFLYNFFSVLNYPKDLNEYLKAVASNGRSDPFYEGFYWGVYRIINDTIVAQYTDNASKTYLAPWNAGETRFKIVDRNTLQHLSDRDFKKSTDGKMAAAKNSNGNTSSVIYHPVDVIPPPYTWLKKEKWLWANEENWRKFMESVK